MYIFNLIDNVIDKDIIELLKGFILVWKWVVEVLNKLFIFKTGKTIWMWILGLIIVGIVCYLIRSELNVSRDNKIGRVIYEMVKNIFDRLVDFFSRNTK